jgi:hypothetical protein
VEEATSTPDLTLTRLFARFALAGLAAMITIGAIAFVAVRRLATAGAIRQAKELTQLAGRGIAEPLITPGVLRGAPEDLNRLDRAVAERILHETPIVRVKIWDSRGREVAGVGINAAMSSAHQPFCLAGSPVTPGVP